MFKGKPIGSLEMLLITIVSMGIVFAALILLTFMLKAFKGIFYKEKKIKSEPTNVVPIKEELVIDNVDDEDEEELIAVITAALANSMSTSIDNILIRNIKRVHQTTPVWGRTGRLEQVSK